MTIERLSNFVVPALHTDGQFGCGGTMARLIEDGAIVTYVAFSAAPESGPEGFPPAYASRAARSATTTRSSGTTDLSRLSRSGAPCTSSS